MRTRLDNLGYRTDTTPDTSKVTVDLTAWFIEQANVGSQAWLLAHALDGVIWGRIDAGKLRHSGEVFPAVSPLLRPETLLEARVFGELAQVHLWRSAQGFSACRIEDVEQIDKLAFDEQHLLWGTAALDRKDGFTLLADGREGLRHAVPTNVPSALFQSNSPRYRPVRLRVRHYIGYDTAGQALIVARRLVALTVAPQESNKERTDDTQP